MTQFPISYPYKPKKSSMIVGFFFFALCAYILMEMAQTNDRGLKLNIPFGLGLSFSPSEAVLFYWILCVLSCAMSLLSFLGLICIYRASNGEAEIVFTNKRMFIHSSIFNPRKTLVIRYNEILSLQLHHIGRIRFLKIIHKQGKIYLRESFLPQKFMFDEIVGIFYIKVR